MLVGWKVDEMDGSQNVDNPAIRNCVVPVHENTNDEDLDFEDALSDDGLHMPPFFPSLFSAARWTRPALQTLLRRLLETYLFHREASLEVPS
jgi:hypothetical protein